MIFSAYIKTITALTIFSTMACMFLPNNSFRKYLELVLGILVLSAVLQPLSAVFQWDELAMPNWQAELDIPDTLLEEDDYLLIEEERLMRTTEITAETTSVADWEETENKGW